MSIDDRFTGRYNRPMHWSKEDDRKIKRKNKLRWDNPAVALAGLPAGYTIEHDRDKNILNIWFGKRLLLQVTEEELNRFINK